MDHLDHKHGKVFPYGLPYNYAVQIIAELHLLHGWMSVTNYIQI